MYSIKDTANLAEYNVWSGSDYLGNTSGIDGGHIQKVSSSSDFSANGDKSFKINFDENSFLYINFIAADVDPNETYTAQLKVYNNSGESMKLRLIETTNTHYTETTINSMNSIQTITASITTTSTGPLKLQVNNNSHVGIIYVDDVILIKH